MRANCERNFSKTAHIFQNFQKEIKLLVILPMALSLSLTGCKNDAKFVLPRICPYFPESVIYKFDKRVLWIQTKVDGISRATAGALFAEACEKAQIKIGNDYLKLTTELNFDGRSVLVIGFKQYLVIWEVRKGVAQGGLPLNYLIMTPEEAQPWFQQHLGYAPTPDRILVITLQDAEKETSKQPIQLRTLADFQRQPDP